MAEISELGYQHIRNYIEENWKFIELQDELGAKVLRLDTSDSRVSWTHTPGAEVLELSIVVTGSDAEITLPQKLAASAVYTSAEATEPVTLVEPFSNFELSTTEDKLTIHHKIEVPELIVI